MVFFEILYIGKSMIMSPISNVSFFLLILREKREGGLCARLVKYFGGCNFWLQQDIYFQVATKRSQKVKFFDDIYLCSLF